MLRKPEDAYHREHTGTYRQGHDNRPDRPCRRDRRQRRRPVARRPPPRHPRTAAPPPRSRGRSHRQHHHRSNRTHRVRHPPQQPHRHRTPRHRQTRDHPAGRTRLPTGDCPARRAEGNHNRQAAPHPLRRGPRPAGHDGSGQDGCGCRAAARRDHSAAGNGNGPRRGGGGRQNGGAAGISRSSATTRPRSCPRTGTPPSPFARHASGGPTG
jgi:hypothetical protein